MTMKGVDIKIDRANTPKEIQIASVDDIWKRKKQGMDHVWETEHLFFMIRYPKIEFYQ